VTETQGGPPQLVRYDPVRCPHGVVVAYDVYGATRIDDLPVVDDWCPACQLGAMPEGER
jgi:hypothetical protein